MLYEVRAGLETEGWIGVMLQGLGLWKEASSWCTMGKARAQGGLCMWRVCVGSGGAWTRGWKRIKGYLIKGYQVDKLHQGQESPGAEFGWRPEEQWGTGDAACPALALPLVLLWPGLEIPGPWGLWPEGEGCTLRAHPRERPQAGYVSPKLSGWSRPLQPFFPKAAGVGRQLWGGKGDCSSQPSPRPPSCLSIHHQGWARPRSDGYVTHQSQRSLCGSLASLLCSLVKAQTPSPCSQDSHQVFLLL